MPVKRRKITPHIVAVFLADIQGKMTGFLNIPFSVFVIERSDLCDHCHEQSEGEEIFHRLNRSIVDGKPVEQSWNRQIATPDCIQGRRSRRTLVFQ
jgi:hypothetical protein